MRATATNPAPSNRKEAGSGISVDPELSPEVLPVVVVLLPVVVVLSPEVLPVVVVLLPVLSPEVLLPVLSPEVLLPVLSPEVLLPVVVVLLPVVVLVPLLVVPHPSGVISHALKLPLIDNSSPPAARSVIMI
jgi:signal-induced proliferation-associated 1 like protein 3